MSEHPGERVVIHVQNPAVLDVPAVRDLLRKSLSGFADDEDAVVEHVRGLIPSRDTALFLVRDGADFTAMALCRHAEGVPYCHTPSVWHLYVPRDHEAKRLLAEAIRAWCEALGFRHVYGLNSSHLSDVAYCHTFEPVGTGERVASVLRWSWGEGPEEEDDGGVVE